MIAYISKPGLNKIILTLDSENGIESSILNEVYLADMQFKAIGLAEVKPGLCRLILQEGNKEA